MEKENISPYSNKINKNITLEDIKLFYKDRFIDFTNLPNNRYNLITSIILSNNLKFLGKIDSNDLWLETENNIYLFGLPNSPTRSWYKIKEINEIDLIHNYFEKVSEKDPTNVFRFGIKVDINKQYNFSQFIQFVFFNEFTEKKLCEIQSELNNSIKDSLICLEDQVRIYNEFIKLDNKSFYIKTKYSKSIIFCEYYETYIIVNILYNEIKIKNRYEKYPQNLPSDISIIFNGFEKIFYSDIFELLQKENNFELIKIYIDILFKITESTKIKKDLNTNNIKSVEIKDYIKNKFIKADSDIIFNKIERDGIFKAFENSFDILIKTFYEKINQNDKDLDSLYLTEKLKNKINETFKIKLI
jgi:hypothetical protein